MSSLIHSIYYPLVIDEGRRTLRQEHDYLRHVEQLMHQVLFTNPGERINRPDFGCGIRRMVFAPNSEVTASLLQITIIQALDRWLGEVISVQEVKAHAINERLEISIAYVVIARQQRRILNLEVTL